MCGGRSREWGSVKNGRSINGYPLSDIVVRSLVNGTAFDVLMNECRNRILYFSLCTAERDSMRVFKSFSEEGRLPNSRGVELLQQRKIVQ